ncbi:MAG: hypothetical protein R3185_00705, partial [Candidatus Thermoplasmatota archaeon]|nr:hypothetical protein [Candidatus Thermoplasmatota archaeon]
MTNQLSRGRSAHQRAWALVLLAILLLPLALPLVQAGHTTEIVRQQALPGLGLRDGEAFGASVAIHGDWAAVGAPDAAVGEAWGAGEVHLYRHRSDGNWTHQGRL